jgi:hypothetical protein
MKKASFAPLPAGSAPQIAHVRDSEARLSNPPTKAFAVPGMDQTEESFVHLQLGQLRPNPGVLPYPQ